MAVRGASHVADGGRLIIVSLGEKKVIDGGLVEQRRSTIRTHRFGLRTTALIQSVHFAAQLLVVERPYVAVVAAATGVRRGFAFAQSAWKRAGFLFLCRARIRRMRLHLNNIVK